MSECVLCNDYCFHKSPQKVDIDKAKWYFSIPKEEQPLSDEISISKKNPIWEPFLCDVAVDDIVTFGHGDEVKWAARVSGCAMRSEEDRKVEFSRSLADFTLVRDGTFLPDESMDTIKGDRTEMPEVFLYNLPENDKFINLTRCNDCGDWNHCNMHGLCSVCADDLRFAKYNPLW